MHSLLPLLAQLPDKLMSGLAAEYSKFSYEEYKSLSEKNYK